jgi:hypothetical protein
MHTWWRAVLALASVSVTVQMAQATTLQPVKDPAGGTLAVILDCNSCKAPGGKKCLDGVENGWRDGKACGQCLVKANFRARLAYPHDLQIVGKLTDPAGKPVAERFVKLFMANGWNVRTRTQADGSFRLALGATAERQEGGPVVTDLGTLVDHRTDNKEQFALFFLPPDYAPCAAAATQPAKPKQP